MSNKTRDPKTEGWIAAVEEAVDIHSEYAGEVVLCAYIKAHHPLIFDECERAVDRLFDENHEESELTGIDEIIEVAERSAEVVRVAEAEVKKPAMQSSDLYQVLVDKLGGMTPSEYVLALDIYRDREKADVFGIEREVIDEALRKASHRSFEAGYHQYVRGSTNVIYRPALLPVVDRGDETERSGNHPLLRCYGHVWPAHRVDERIAKFIRDNRDVSAAICFRARAGMMQSWAAQFSSPEEMKQAVPFLKAALDVAWEGELPEGGNTAWSIALSGTPKHA
jgi:hypothetical protein